MPLSVSAQCTSELRLSLSEDRGENLLDLYETGVVADQWQVEQLLERRTELVLSVPYVLVSHLTISQRIAIGHIMEHAFDRRQFSFSSPSVGAAATSGR